MHFWVGVGIWLLVTLGSWARKGHVGQSPGFMPHPIEKSWDLVVGVCGGPPPTIDMLWKSWKYQQLTQQCGQLLLRKNVGISSAFLRYMTWVL